MTRSTSRDLVFESSHLQSWGSLNEAERKRRAARAVASRDEDELWSLTEAYLLLHGRRGTQISDNTLEAYRHGLTALLEHFEGASLLKVDANQAQLYVRAMEGSRSSATAASSGLAPSSVVQRTVTARHVYDALIWARLIGANPFDGVKVARDPQRPEDKREAYELADVAALVRAAVRDAPAYGERTDLLIVLLTALAGLRASELVALTWSQVDFQDRKIRVTGKGAKTRFTPLADVLALELLRHKRARTDDDPHVLVRSYRGIGPYSTEALRKRIARLCEVASDPDSGRVVPYKALHSFRHTFGTQMQKLISLLDLQLILGHTDVKTTSIYGLSTSEKAAARALGTRAASAFDDAIVAHRDDGVNAIGNLLATELAADLAGDG